MYLISCTKRSVTRLAGSISNSTPYFSYIVTPNVAQHLIDNLTQYLALCRRHDDHAPLISNDHMEIIEVIHSVILLTREQADSLAPLLL